ncbi:MAG: DUF924 family protein [Betaproteobacteria bacterium]
MQPWQAVLDFWFLPPGDPQHGQSRVEWFRKDPAFDAAILRQFAPLLEQALTGGLREWDAELRGALARIIVLDQFTRNAFRDTPRAFAGDALAQAAALTIIESGADRLLAPRERMFAYLPFEHAENREWQERSVGLFSALAKDAGLDDLLDFPMRHRDIVARFGRFPHRNRILERDSTPEEIEFLKLPGSGF